MTQTQFSDKKGGIHKYQEPQITETQRFIVLRGDGGAFGDVTDDGFSSLASLNIKLELPELPPRNKLWSPTGVEKFLRGYRPSIGRVFDRLVSVIDTFIDFSRSLADQDTMCELIACFTLSTWFLDAFNVTGFLWPNGEKGSGKTNLLILISELGFLGQFISSSGTFASLRDLSDCGATLCFDNAENLSDLKLSDPDKRTLLLAGNRRGATVPLKEPTNNRTWRIRYVNTYCPRAFSAIQLPDPTLASRTIIVPLTRTAEKTKVNRDPLDMFYWLCDRQELLDDLWSVGLTHLPELVEVDRWVGENADLKGRTLQPWRAILAIAKWLDAQGVKGLFERMHNLAKSYRTERHNIETSDITRLVIHGIIRCAISAKSAISANQNGNPRYTFSSSEVAETSKLIIDEEELDISADQVTKRGVGRVLSKLRLAEVPRSGGKGSRRRSISLQELYRLAQAYDIEVPDMLKVRSDGLPQSFGIDGTNGTNGTNGTKQLGRGNEADLKGIMATGNHKNQLEGEDGVGISGPLTFLDKKVVS